MSWVGSEFWISNKYPDDTDAIGPWTILNSKDAYHQDLQLNSLRLNSDFNETGSLLSVRGFALARLDRGLVVIQPLSSGWNHDMGGNSRLQWKSIQRRLKPCWKPQSLVVQPFTLQTARTNFLSVSPTRVGFLLLTIKAPNKNYNIMAKRNYDITPWKNNAAIKNHSFKKLY